jgi:type IV secretory pathway component VirB8
VTTPHPGAEHQPAADELAHVRAHEAARRRRIRITLVAAAVVILLVAALHVVGALPPG